MGDTPEHTVEIWHNPRCSKSRQTLQLLRDHGVEPTVRRYLDDPPDEATLRLALTALGVAPRELLRRKEAPYKALDLGDAGRSDDELIAAMAAHPILIERPLVLRGDRAALGRPPEAVKDLL